MTGAATCAGHATGPQGAVAVHIKISVALEEDIDIGLLYVSDDAQLVHVLVIGQKAATSAKVFVAPETNTPLTQGSKSS